MGTCGPVARSLVVALGLEDTPPLEQGARHPPLLGTHRSFQLPGNPRTQRLGLRRFSGSPGAALPEAGVDWAGSQYFWAWALFFFSCKFYFISGLGKRTNSSPEVNTSCAKHVLAQRERLWLPRDPTFGHLFLPLLTATSGEVPLHHAQEPPERPRVIMDLFLL